jgi:hypothetical protein
MTVSDLDRLVSNTEVNDATKSALRIVRKAVMNGECGDAEIGKAVWSIAIDTSAGRQVRMSFNFKRVNDGDNR